MKTLDTLIEDVEGLFAGGHECDPALVAALGQAIAETVARRLKERDEDRKFTLRLSAIGRPDRQLWYDAHHKGVPEPLPPSAKMKFLYGDILECLLLFLAKEAGHEVKDEQKELVVDGVKGHMDCTIDGIPVDAKSCSTFAFKKFKENTLRHQDDFGYMWQIAAYSHAEQAKEAAFFAIDKQLGHMCLLRVPGDELNLYDVPKRIAEQKAVVVMDKPPEFCAEEEPDGKSGNMKIPNSPCGYCKHKTECRPGLKMYAYSNGVRWLTKVVREPKVASDT